MGPGSIRLVDQISESAVQAAVSRNTIFSPSSIRRELVLAVACAIQRGNAQIIEEGHVKCMSSISSSRIMPPI